MYPGPLPVQLQMFGDKVRRSKNIIPNHQADGRLKRRYSEIPSARTSAVVLTDTAKMQRGSTLIFFQQLGRGVRRPIVHYNHFEVCRSLPFQMAETGEENLGPVIRRDNDADRILRCCRRMIRWLDTTIHTLYYM
jgi:hypothetical protein